MSVKAAHARPDGGLLVRRRIWLCADDYGMSASVDRAIRDLVMRGRLNATSVMVVAPSFNRTQALPLTMLNVTEKRVAIGLHVTMTGPLRPLNARFAPLRADGTFLTIGGMLASAALRRIDPEQAGVEVALQLQAFATAFGRLPDFLDGHQHVHLLPGVREAVLKAAKELAPDAWVRQCGSATPWRKRLGDRKGLLIDALSRSFRKHAARLAVRTNPAFAGTYDFHSKAAFADLFPGFLEGLPDDGLVMCHPGHVDAELERLDPLTTRRDEEHAYFSGSDFPSVLADRGVSLKYV